MKLPALFRRDKPPAAEERGWIVGPDFFKTNPNWFQTAADLSQGLDISTNTAVYSCVNILSQEVASLNICHWRVNPDGGREDVNSAASRTLRKPNGYQTRSDFWLYIMRSMLLGGAGYAFAVRNARNEIIELHPLPPRSCQPMVAPNGEVFYSTGNNGDRLFDVESTVPLRNIFNPRINCFRHPLIGETPVAAFVTSAVTGSALQRFMARFYQNMGRPSGVITTPKPLNKTQLEELRVHWNKVTQGDAAGGTPVLHSDMKWQQVTMSAVDAQTIATAQMSMADIAMAYRVPLFMLGDLSKVTFKTVEALMRLFYTSSLRFYLEHLENALNALFGLDGETEYLEFDIEAGLLRGELEQRMNAWAKAVQGGVMTPNEAREREELPPEKGGDRLFLQKQMVPLDLMEELLRADAAKTPAAAPAPADTGTGGDAAAQNAYEELLLTAAAEESEDA